MEMQSSNLSLWVAAWVQYAGIVGGIYSASSKLADLIRSDYIEKFTNASTRPYAVARLFQNINSRIRLFVDKVLKFHRINPWLYVPSLRRSLLSSFLMLIFIAWPTVALLEQIRFFPSNSEELSIYAIRLAIFYVFIAPADYLSFIKSRALLNLTEILNNNWLKALVYIVDPILSAAVVLLFTTVFLSVAFVLGHYLMPKEGGLGTIMLGFLLEELIMEYAATVTLATSATASFISICSLMIYLSELIVSASVKIEPLRELLIKYFNFQNKPFQVSAAVLIVILTIVYWPVAIFFIYF